MDRMPYPSGAAREGGPFSASWTVKPGPVNTEPSLPGFGEGFDGGTDALFRSW